ncbi:MAG: FtsX-like permease family protein [Bacteroidetes bacterium]|nr:FtsX-like permease family protein [Bacteroidota bacterium]
MIQFLLKGILRDRSRSVLPVIVVAIGVFISVFMYSWMKGIFGDVIRLNANFTTGHVKVMTRAYAENSSQLPIDLALLDVSELIGELEADYPDMEWVERIRFGGLIDVPDENGETKTQGPAFGQAVDLLSPDTKEPQRMNMEKSLRRGRLPSVSGEVLLSEDFAQKLKVDMGQEVMLFGSTMDGGMAFKNFKVVGTVSFGSIALDRGAIIVDITDAQQALDMRDAASEILGYFGNNIYDDEKAAQLATSFNEKFEDDPDEFAPEMYRLKEMSGMASYMEMADSFGAILVSVFVFAMSIVLWNTGLLGGLRRYSEFGVRLALGEGKGHIYKTLIYEAILIGIIGSIVGTAFGVALGFYMQEHGIDFSSLMKNSSMMLPQVYRAVVTPTSFIIGFIPGLISMVVGTALSGIGIYKRQTAQLFNELEV